MFLFIDNYDSFSWNLVQAFYALGRKPVVYANDDPRILDLAASPELEAVCISPGPSHPRNAGLCLEFLKRLPAAVPVLGVCLGHQLLGYFAGADIRKLKVKKFGFRISGGTVQTASPTPAVSGAAGQLAPVRIAASPPCCGRSPSPP